MQRTPACAFKIPFGANKSTAEVLARIHRSHLEKRSWGKETDDAQRRSMSRVVVRIMYGGDGGGIVMMVIIVDGDDDDTW